MSYLRPAYPLGKQQPKNGASRRDILFGCDVDNLFADLEIGEYAVVCREQSDWNIRVPVAQSAEDIASGKVSAVF
ncbi:MAG: hypothetical protein M1829_003922 [Trizodia sp. TS-e1964]|nr:MAG: hypothetical protein M1829_003922 [Trizodia sp. TS-e1964]